MDAWTEEVKKRLTEKEWSVLAELKKKNLIKVVDKTSKR